MQVDMKLIGELITQILYIAPLCVLIYRLGRIHSEHDNLKDKVGKLEEDYGVHVTNETIRWQEVMSKIADIANTVSRIDTKLEERTSKARTEQ